VQKKLEPDHPSLATTLGNLAGVLRAQGKLTEAESLYRKSLAIEEKKLEPDHPSLATTLGNLAAVLQDQGKLTEAESLYRKSLAIVQKKLEPDHPSLATTLGNLAAVLHAQGKLTEAESLFRKSLAIFEKKLEPDHPSLATTLGNLAGVLKDQGKLTEAESLFRKSLAIEEKKLEPDHPSLATAHANLSVLRLARGDLMGAVAEEQKSIQGFDQQLRTSLTEDQAEALLTANSAGENFVYGLPLLSGAPPEAGRLAMSTAMLFKGRTLEAGRMVRRKLQQGLKTEAQKQKYQTMVELLGQRDQELSRLAQGSGQRDKAQQLLWQAQKLERELSKEVGVMSSADVPTLENVTQKVAQALRTDSDAVLVEVGLAMTADYSRGSNMEIAKTGAFHYVAMMLFPSGEVRVVRLGGKDEVESVAATFLAALNSGSKDMKAVAQAAYSALFAPLEKELGGANRIILSPDGALSAIPFAALHDDKGYLVERLSFRYVSSGRDLLEVPSQQPTGQPAVMMATRVPGQNPLPDAEQTGRELAQMQRAKLTTGATDGQVLVQQSPSVLTLISHGYFRAETKTYGMSARLPTAPKQRVRPKYMNQMAFERDSPAQAPVVMAEKENTEELMNSAGLMMMPGPTASTDSKQDGRLTGVEVREMNLQGTKLVMLLACNGAAGGVSFGQGVYGLRRAVLQAGAETVVGTLWSVEEKSASDLAKRYMTKLWTDKKATRVGAMEEAMKELRQDPRYSHPHYWAPFVVMGMDGPLAH
jgi:CHAT domain-containing protein/Tfp pilus assembly protein PilF